jgi:hypothetical protein
MVTLLATFALAACGTETSGEVGSVDLSLTLNGAEVDSVQYVVSGGALGEPIKGTLAVQGDQVYGVITNLPVGTNYVITLTAFNNGEPVCVGSSDPFDIVANQTTQVNVVLTCGEETTVETGNAEINGSINVVGLNICPVVHSYVAIPDAIEGGGSSNVQVVASDFDGDALSYSWTATSGSFDDASSSDPVYTCDLPGTQTLTAVVSDGEADCDQTVEITVGCGGTPLCQDVVCEPTGACTSSACDPSTGQCVESNVANGTDCGNGGACQDGACVVDLCAGVDCNTNNDCTTSACDANTGACGAPSSVANGTACDGGSGVCEDGTCNPADLCVGVNCDDQDPCTADVCDAGTGKCVLGQPAPNGTACPGGTCQAGICTPSAPSAKTVLANVVCELPLGLGNADVDVELTVAPVSAFTPNGTTTVDLSAVATIPAELGQLLIGLQTDQINIDSLLADVNVAGGSPSPISVTKSAVTLDVDQNNDGTAEDLVIPISVPSVDVTNNGAATVDFSVNHFEAFLSGVPLLGSIVVSEDTPPSTIPCTLSSTTATFAVN